MLAAVPRAANVALGVERRVRPCDIRPAAPDGTERTTACPSLEAALAVANDRDVGSTDLALLLGAWGPCPAYDTLLAAESAASPSGTITPQGLAESLGFATLEEFAWWLGGLGAEERATVLSVLEGGE